MIDFPEQDLPNFSEIANGLAQSWPQIREITLHPYLDDPDFTSKHSFVIVVQHNGSFHGVEEGKFLEHVCGFLHKKNFSNNQYDEYLILPIGPDEPFPQQAVRDVSTTLYKREGITEEALRQRTQPHDEMSKEKLRLEQEECDRRRDEYFNGSHTRISGKKKKEMAARLLSGRKPQLPISSLTDAEIDALGSSVKFPRGLNATEEARYWRVMAREAMKSTDSVPELEQFTPGTLDIPAPENTDPEAFMRSLSIAYLSDSEVSIKVGNREPEKCTSREMGFEKKPKLWQPFIKLLQTTDHKYHVGTYSRDKDPVKNQNYNKLVKQLSNFSKLFLSFLNDKFSVSLPMGFNVYQNMKGHEKAGTYKLKFHIVDRHEDTQSTDIKMMTETEIINKIRSLSEQLQKKDNLDKDQLLQEIGHYATHATKMRWITEEQLRNMITPPDADPSRDDAMLLAVSNRENNGF